MPTAVYLHHDFELGSRNDNELCDYRYLTYQERTLFHEFIIDVEDGAELLGRNKSSCTNSQGDELHSRQANFYRSHRLWHYHIGPYSNKNAVKKTIRSTNLQGARSAAVIHYRWFGPLDTSSIVILGFSRDHNPFPALQESEDFKGRLGFIFRSKLKRLFDPDDA
ncbi:hypothetical protein [Marinobacterium mangrovicola]|uniref:Uncharacterized protein n=1 Tax=Marinobacterium mangrovicola TaxID=1476959 RepID=A0A4R1GS64_9GAMM|nr:hypothetical protein [Marinobacterium mangrovicola]TCK09069.1 hypothetical protein CLV83_1170 [Marinobacterium mangrovicola]